MNGLDHFYERSRDFGITYIPGSVPVTSMGIGTLGGAALDNEENYLLKKLFTALGAIQIENQARI